MKRSALIAIFAFTLSVLLAGRGVLAAPVDSSVTGEANATPEMCDHAEGKGKRMERLKSDLNLNKNQETAWTEWTGKVMGNHKSWEERRKSEALMAELPAPDRMEKRLSLSKEHSARQEMRLAATKAFYATLSPVQRQVFDKGFNFEHHYGFGKCRKQ